MTLGIAGFGALASLTPYRSYFLVVAIAALLRSYWVTYRPRWPMLRAAGFSAYRPQAHEVALWVVTGLVVLLATFPYYNPFLSMGFGS